MRRVLIGLGSTSRTSMMLHLVMVTLGYYDGVAQPVVCPDSSYTLTTQAEVDAFPPDCTEISGDLIVGPSTEITDLSVLSAIVTVAGELWIWHNDALTSLDGLSALTAVGGRLIIRSNPALTDLEGFSALTSLEFLSIEGNNSLADLDGLSGLASVGWLYIQGTILTNLDGLSALITFGTLDILDNHALTNIDGLSTVAGPVGRIDIRRNNRLTNIDGLSRITSVEESVWIGENFALTNVDGFSGLTSVDESFSISYNYALTNIDGLSAITTLGYVWIIGNPLLANVDGLSALTTVGGYLDGRLVLEYNNALTNLDGLARLTNVGGISIIRNAALTNLDGLSALTSVDGDLRLESNNALTNLDGISGLTSLGGLRLRYNPSLTNLNGISGLTSFGSLEIGAGNGFTNLDAFSGLVSLKSLRLLAYDLENIDGLSGLTGPMEAFLVIEDTPLTDLDALSGITSVGTLRIRRNRMLTDLDGLSALQHVGDDLEISDNNALSNLDGLAGLDSIGGYLFVAENATLSSCSCGLYTCVSRDCVTGSITMTGNALSGDCNNDGLDLVVNECTAAPGEVTLANPADGTTGVGSYTELLWDATPGADRYHLQVDLLDTFSQPLVNDSTLSDTSYTASEPFSYSTTYYWRVRAGLDNGVGKTTELLFGPWSETRTFTVAVGTATEGEPTIPTAFALHPAYPNPFNPSTTITYDVPNASEVRLTVFDALGRQVEALGTWNVAPGTYSVTWEARTVPSGVYFVRMDAGAFRQSQRVLLLK